MRTETSTSVARATSGITSVSWNATVRPLGLVITSAEPAGTTTRAFTRSSTTRRAASKSTPAATAMGGSEGETGIPPSQLMPTFAPLSFTGPEALTSIGPLPFTLTFPLACTLTSPCAAIAIFEPFTSS